MAPSDMRCFEQWARCLPFLRPAIDRLGGTHLPDDVYRQIAMDESQFWPMERSAAVTEVVVYPQIMACNVFLAGGDLDEIVEWQKPGGALERWAFALGCSRIETTGRPGWAKAADGETALTCIIRKIGHG